MIRRSTTITIMTLLIISAAYAQKPADPAGLPRPQWEYLVISYGQAYFESPSKTEGYLSAPSQAGQEALNLQRRLDGLGLVGWELVAVVGTIGGDQELLLKRKNDPALTKKEHEFLENQKAKALAEMLADLKAKQAEAERTAKLEAEKKVLVDLDQKDHGNVIDKNDAAVNSYIAELARAFNSENLVKSEITSDGSMKTIRLQYDLTSTSLSNVNEYRKSQVLKYLASQIDEITVDRYSLLNCSLQIIGEAYLKFNGKLVKVAEYVTYSQPVSQNR